MAKFTHLLVILVILHNCPEVLGTDPRLFVNKDTAPKEKRFTEAVQVFVHTDKAISNISSHFVGVTLDSSLIARNWDTLDFNSKAVQNLAHALTPAYLRLGGTAADCVNFIPPNPEPPRDPWWDKCTNDSNTHKDINLTVTQWEAVNEFVQTVGFDFIMDLNVLHRYFDDAWYIDNTRQLLEFSISKNYTIAGFELGNEYDLFKETFNYSMEPYRLSRDYISLQRFLGIYPLYASSMILGPETAGLKEEYFKEFLLAGGADIVRASTFHHYYFKGKGAVVSNFTDVWIMESLRSYLTDALTQSRSVNASLRSWLSETSSSYGGGTPNISDRFVAGFLWLDKLGLCAEMGIETVIRQAFYGGSYSLIDRDLNPNPDYWLTLLYKQLVRGPVFKVSSDPGLRVYAACASYGRFGPGAVVVYYLNPDKVNRTLELPQFLGSKLLLYILTAGDADGLTSKFTALNGRKLELSGNNLPNLNPTPSGSSSVDIPLYSFGFIVVPSAKVTLCVPAHKR